MRNGVLIKLPNALSKLVQPPRLDLPAPLETFPPGSSKTRSATERVRGLTARLGSDYHVLVWAAVLALIQGLFYISLVPPWQHYDEPSHFEFAWLIANRGMTFEKNISDQGMRRELAASMIEHDFFGKMDSKPNLLSQGDEIWIGISQINPRSLYYLLAGAPLRLFRSSDIAFQLYLVRSVSLLLLLLTIVAAWGIARELTRTGHPLRWMLPLSVALVPGFVDIMSAANDDVGAAAFFALFLWSGVRMIKRGFSWPRLLILALLALACFWVKNTVTIAVLLFVLPVALSFARSSLRRIAFIALGAVLVVAVLSIVRWGDAAYWIRYSFPDRPSQQTVNASPLGESAVQIPLNPHQPVPRLVQVIPIPISRELRGKKVTIGSWIWADAPTRVLTPLLVTSSGTFSKEVEVGENPTFFSYTAKIDDDNSKLSLALSPGRPSGTGFQVYYDGIVMVEGKRPQKSPPAFDDPAGQRGLWGRRAFTNLLRNGSAEKGWPWILSWSDKIFNANFPGRLSLILAFLLDRGTSLNYYQAAAQRILESFWAGFGWGQIKLLGSNSQLILGLAALLGVIGAIVGLIRNRRTFPWDILLFLGTATLLIWGAAIVRGTNSIIDGNYLLPVARYTYPAIIPVLMMLNLGWLEFFQLLENRIKVPALLKIAPFWLFFGGLSILGLLTILRFYNL